MRLLKAFIPSTVIGVGFNGVLLISALTWDAMDHLAMVAESRSLFELLVAVVHITRKRKEVCVGIHMLCHVLLLPKPSPTFLTLILLVVLVCDDKMTLQAKP